MLRKCALVFFNMGWPSYGACRTILMGNRSTCCYRGVYTVGLPQAMGCYPIGRRSRPLKIRLDGGPFTTSPGPSPPRDSAGIHRLLSDHQAIPALGGIRAAAASPRREKAVSGRGAITS